MRAASFRLNRERVPRAYPTPPRPGRPFGRGEGTGAVAFAGAAWAAGYEVEVRGEAGGEVVSRVVVDDSVKEGEFGVGVGCGKWWVRVRGVGVGGEEGQWSEETEATC